MNSEALAQREAWLRRAVLGGDEDAWRTWYLESFDALDGFILWRCGGRRELADDVAQETWLTAIRSVRRFDPRQGSFAAWLRGLAINALRHQLRRQARQRRRERTAGEQRTADLRTAQPLPDDRIAVTLDALSERHEAVLRAKYLDGQSVAEIAATWNETPKTIESLLTRARQAFRERFEKEREGS